MKSLMVVSLVSAFLYAGLARAEDPVSMLSNNPEEGVTKLKFMDGKIATVNGFLGEIEVPGSDGTVYHVSFEDAALEAASGDPALARSEERRVGKEGVRTCRSGWCPDHKKKNKKITT